MKGLLTVTSVTMILLTFHVFNFFSVVWSFSCAMSAFSTEFGVCDEVENALQTLEWQLPTDVQSEACPLILGGGDVLMAAETGSGKTGAFCIPVVQIVLETLREKRDGAKGTAITKSAGI